MPDVTCHTLLYEPLPTLLPTQLDKHCTAGPSTSYEYGYVGDMTPWEGINREVDTCIHDSTRDNTPNRLDVLFQRQHNTQAPIELEVLICAEEKGVETRFSQQVMHTVENAAMRHPLNARLGDYRATYKTEPIARGRPDFSCMGRGDQHPRFFGECKADWDDSILRSFAVERSRKRWLAQIVGYMNKWRLRYGFLTTYRYTVFVRCRHSTTNPSAQSLEYSHPIPHTQQYVQGKTVTVRQIMWYLMLEVHRGNWKMTPDDAATSGTGTRLDTRSKTSGLPTGPTGPPKGPTNKGPPSDPRGPPGGPPIDPDDTKKAAHHPHGPGGPPARKPSPNRPDLKVLSRDEWKNLKRGDLHRQNHKGKPVEWQMTRGEKDPGVQIQRENIKLRQGPNGKVFVYFGRKDDFLLRVPAGLRAELEQCADNQALQRLMANLHLSPSGKQHKPK